MNEVLAQLDRNTIVGFILVLARVSPLFLLAPPFNSSMVPARARLIIACGSRSASRRSPCTARRSPPTR